MDLKYIIYSKKSGKIIKAEGHKDKEDLRKHVVMTQFIENIKE